MKYDIQEVFEEKFSLILLSLPIFFQTFFSFNGLFLYLFYYFYFFIVRLGCLFIRDYLEKLSVHSRIYEFKKNRLNLVCRLASKTAKKKLLFTPHVDTVPAGSGWKFPPFSGRIYQGKVYGRGAALRVSSRWPQPPEPAWRRTPGTKPGLRCGPRTSRSARRW